MTTTKAYTVRNNGLYWAGEVGPKLNPVWSPDILDATLIRVEDVAEEIAEELKANVVPVDLVRE